MGEGELNSTSSKTFECRRLKGMPSSLNGQVRISILSAEISAFYRPNA